MNAFMLTATVIVAVSASGWKDAPVPVYLLGASDSVKEAFHKVVSNSSMSVEQRQSAIKDFISKQSEEIQEAYRKFEEAMEAAKSRAIESVPQIVPV